jgi:adenylate kinase
MGKKTKKMKIVITGSVGTGKSSVSAELARLIGHRHVDVGKIVLANRKKLGAGYDRKRKSVVADLGKTKKFLAGKKFLYKGNIIEGHYSQELADNPDFVFVLRCEPSELDRRLMERKYDRRKRAENVLAEILDSCAIESEARFGKKVVFEIGTDGKAPEKVAAEIGKILSGKKTKKRFFDFSEKYLGAGAEK